MLGTGTTRKRQWLSLGVSAIFLPGIYIYVLHSLSSTVEFLEQIKSFRTVSRRVDTEHNVTELAVRNEILCDVI